MSRYRWTILALGTVAQASYSAVFLGIPVLALQFRDEYELSLTEIGVVLAAFSIGSVAPCSRGVFLPGRWSDRVGTRIAPLLKLAFALSVALAVSSALTAAPLTVFVPAFLVAGALSQSWNGLSFTATVELAGRRRAGAALGLQQTALAVASSLAPPLFALLVESTSWGVAFALAATLPLAGAGLMRRIPA